MIMPPKKTDTQRVEMNYPVKLLDEIERYKEERSIPNRTTAVLDLIRKGLNKS